MATPVKVSVVGAGSAVFSLGLVKDLCLTESLRGSEVSLIDVAPERLAVVHALAARYARELGADLRFEATADRAASLRDADFVINTAYVKGHHHERRQRELAARHGYYYGGVDPGDYYNLQLMLDVARDVERICPDAWLIQSGNPVFEGCTLLTRETGVRVIGLCHGHYGYREIAATIGLDPDRIEWQAPGLNHCIWLTRFRLDGPDGHDAYPMIDEWIATQGEEYWRSHVATRTHDIQMSRAACHLYRLYGLFPIGDTPRMGATTTNWWYHADLETKLRWFGQPWGGPDTELARPRYVAGHERRLAEIAELLQDRRASVSAVLGQTKTREQQVPIIDALTNDVAGEFQVNVPNRGTLAGLPDDVVVEVPAVVDRAGVRPQPVVPLPPKLMLEQVLPRWLEMERSLLAFQTGDWTMLLWQALSSHQTRSYEQARAALDDLLALAGNEELARHYPRPPGL